MTDSNVNLNEESEMIYEEMLEVAKSIHPNARVRPSSDRQGYWEIYIPTMFEEVRELPERFDSTPAAEAAELIDSSGVSCLENYARTKGYDKFPLDCAADYYNMDNEVMELMAAAMMNNNRNKDRALEEIAPQMTAMRAMLDMKWLED